MASNTVAEQSEPSYKRLKTVDGLLDALSNHLIGSDALPIFVRARHLQTSKSC